MKILLVTQYFYPENFKGNDIAFEMQKKGHEVTVLTGFPNYPKTHRLPYPQGHRGCEDFHPDRVCQPST